MRYWNIFSQSLKLKYFLGKVVQEFKQESKLPSPPFFKNHFYVPIINSKFDTMSFLVHKLPTHYAQLKPYYIFHCTLIENLNQTMKFYVIL